MALTAAQQTTLKTDITSAANAAALGAFIAASDWPSVAIFYNGVAVPDFWVWRSFVSQTEYVSTTSVDGTTWSWPQYITRSQGERDGWREMFADARGVNPSLVNVRQAVADIFSGVGAAPVAQRTHLLTISRRKASLFEKLFATGTGLVSSPALMGLEGSVSADAVQQAMLHG